MGGGGGVTYNGGAPYGGGGGDPDDYTTGQTERWGAEARRPANSFQFEITGGVYHRVVIDRTNETKRSYTKVEGGLLVDGTSTTTDSSNRSRVNVSGGISREVIENMENMVIGLPDGTLFYKGNGETAKYRCEGSGLTGPLTLTQENHVIHGNQLIISTSDGRSYVYTKVEEQGT